MNVRKSDFKTDGHGWAEMLTRRTPQPILRENIHADWVVVGAGVTGLAVARQLAVRHPDAQIVLLDAREVAQGASARSSGFCVDSSRFGGPIAALDIADCKRVNRINRAGLSLLRRQVSQGGISCDWREEGLYHVAADTKSQAEHGDFVDYLNALELGHETLSQDALKQRLGTSHYTDGVRVQDGALVQPAALVRGLASTLPPNVTLYENTPVLDIAAGSQKIVTVPDVSIRTPNVMLCTNYEIGRLGYLRSRLTGAVLSGSFTRQLTQDEMDSLGDATHWGLMSLHSVGATVRLTADRRISIRNTSEFRFSKLLSESALHKRVQIHRASFEMRFAQLKHVPFAFSWSGVEGISANMTNFFGPVEQGIWFAGGFNGSGLSRGTAFGTALADYASGDDTDLVRDCLQSKPAQWIPPEPFRTFGGGIVARMRSMGRGRDG